MHSQGWEEGESGEGTGWEEGIYVQGGPRWSSWPLGQCPCLPQPTVTQGLRRGREEQLPLKCLGGPVHSQRVGLGERGAHGCCRLRVRVEGDIPSPGCRARHSHCAPRSPRRGQGLLPTRCTLGKPCRGRRPLPEHVSRARGPSGRRSHCPCGPGEDTEAHAPVFQVTRV